MDDEQRFWDKAHKRYSAKGYGQKPSIFAQEFVEILTRHNIDNGRILELGGGLGQDGRYFMGIGFDVVSTDLKKSDDVKVLDMREIPWPFANDEFDIVYAHLSLHYFDAKTTRAIFSEIWRVLKNGGILAFFANSKSDPQYDKKEEVEDGLMKINGKLKRYFDVKMVRDFTKDFTEILVDNNGETYKDSEIGVHNLIRFIGKKEVA
jgi:SAM-dependent methyltransferase